MGMTMGTYLRVGYAFLGVRVRVCSGTRIASRYVLKYFLSLGL